MLLTLLTVAVLIVVTGLGYNYLIIIAALLLYLYPILSAVLLACLALGKWQGPTLKRKITQYLDKLRKRK